MNAGARVELEDVAKRYETAAGVVRAVDGVSIDVRSGSSLAITGPSGCGKSTLLGLIGGLDIPSAGRVSIGGREISALSDAERSRVRRHEIGSVFQSDNLLPFLTATENIGLQLSLDGSGDGVGRSSNCWPGWASKKKGTGSPTSSPEGSASAWPWPEP